ncbi:8-oxo-dGTP pyrophosphatase MutT (NUDIX family) [Spinactinospora alkalitolerans]|uniref:8-oxo-dGTP pyrophosphatase MutT (NUDIX family) n=1 Tax=Spinactinospora alkalitolerans TaxID=687207 RepID=A0A852TWY2_9ACTN|nr:NUDIX hydrolase [Spinactinospora alkalitolerans]NYE47392.1 8-oxo-dGTP pyrophosphatase MutT (NUDIX family) [Spinactinospora alkalitolerans]
MADTELEFFESLPRTRGAAIAVLRDARGRVLLVKPTYKPGWGLPGGVIEMGESPLAACRRECAEELGFVPKLTGLVCVDWRPSSTAPDHRPCTVFVFSGVLAPGQFEAVRLPADELSDAVMAEPGDVADRLPAAAGRRVALCLESDRVLYLEDGYEVTWGR